MRNLKLVVDPAVQRRGLGTVLLRAVLAQAPEAGPLTLQASMWAGWAAGVVPLAGRLAEIHNTAYGGDAGFSRFDAEAILSSLADALLWVAERDGAVVAFAAIESDDEVSWLESLAVDPAHQGRGIGGLLASRASLGDGVGEGRLAGLSVSSANPRALRLYERLGFVRGRERGKYAAARGDLLARFGG